MLDSTLKAQVSAYFQKLNIPVSIQATLDDSDDSLKVKALLEDLVSAAPGMVSFTTDGSSARVPSFKVGPRVEFAGLPLGHEFTSLVLAVLYAGGHPPKVDESLIYKIKSISKPTHLDVYVSLSCHNCPDVVQAAQLMAYLNPNISATMVEGSMFEAEVSAKNIMAVPVVYSGEEAIGHGRMSIEELVAKVVGSEGSLDESLKNKPVFDVLVVGGGPAGAAAAIYASRKGIKTGLIAQRFGGQVMDTVGIENFISTKYTEGPKLVAGLEEHVKEYPVDIMTMQEAVKLRKDPEGLHVVELKNNVELQAKRVILATGAKWREMNVPGEKHYRGKGVGYCPHCDGPFFKGKRVAVIGGGNSGVEAAIDLAGIVSHVTLLEFSNVLKADAVLQDKLMSLPNVTVIKKARTVEVTGDGKVVNGLVYENLDSGEKVKLELEGIFVQIGLLPNTEWLRGDVSLTKFGEVEVNAHGETSLPGVFAAGDCTTSPYKQIIIAMGSGANAALGAFDSLIRE